MRETRPRTPSAAVPRARGGLVMVVSKDLQPREAAVPEVFRRCFMAALHPEWAKVEPGVVLGRRQERKRAPIPHQGPAPWPAELLSPAVQWASEARAWHSSNPQLTCGIADRSTPMLTRLGSTGKSHVFCDKDDDFFFFQAAFPVFSFSI